MHRRTRNREGMTRQSRERLALASERLVSREPEPQKQHGGDGKKDSATPPTAT